MIELNGIINQGNYAFAGHPTRPNSPAEISLTGDTEIQGGNFVLARITTNGFTLTRSGGNCRGLRTRTNPGDAWVKIDNYTVSIKKPLPLAVQIRETIQASGGEDALAAWDFAVESILASPTINEADWEAQQMAWANKTGAYAGRQGKRNMIAPAAALERIIDSFFQFGTFEAVRDSIAAYDIETWQGAPTQLAEEIS